MSETTVGLENIRKRVDSHLSYHEECLRELEKVQAKNRLWDEKSGYNELKKKYSRKEEE
jgi:hypothetical protein